jgi:alanine dehydrogenase
VLIPGAKAPKLITRKTLAKVRKRAVLVDVCIDQGGVSETSRPTTHSDPTYLVGNVLHYCVANMPGAYGRSATLAYSNALAPYAVKLANQDLKGLCGADTGFSSGVNICGGKAVYPPVAEALRLPYTPLKKVLL